MSHTWHSEISFFITVFYNISYPLFVAFSNIIILHSIIFCGCTSDTFTSTPFVSKPSSACFFRRKLLLSLIVTSPYFIVVFLNIVLKIGWDNICLWRVLWRNGSVNLLVRRAWINFPKFEIVWIYIPIITSVFLHSWIIIARRNFSISVFIIQILSWKYCLLDPVLPFVWQTKLKLSRFSLSWHLVFSIYCSTNWKSSFY